MPDRSLPITARQNPQNVPILSSTGWRIHEGSLLAWQRRYPLRHGRRSQKDDPDKVARDGFDAMVSGEGQIVSSSKNKVQATMAHIIPSDTLAEQRRKMAAPGTAKH